MRLRDYKRGSAEDIGLAIAMLRRARDLLKGAGAHKTADRVRKALTSAGGAERHIRRLEFRHLKSTTTTQGTHP